MDVVVEAAIRKEQKRMKKGQYPNWQKCVFCSCPVTFEPTGGYYYGQQPASNGCCPTCGQKVGQKSSSSSSSWNSSAMKNVNNCTKGGKITWPPNNRGGAVSPSGSLVDQLEQPAWCRDDVDSGALTAPSSSCRKSTTTLLPNAAEKKQEQQAINDNAKLKFLRLLTPNTKKNRWQYTSWHHTGEFRRLPNGTVWTDRQGCNFEDPPQSTILPLSRGSVFKDVRKTSTDFIIHPDWI